MPTTTGKLYLGSIFLSGGSTPSTGYQRPGDWLTLPTVNATDQVFYGLYAVFDHESNFITVSATDAYTVDWGDGTTENYASGVTAYRNYDYNAAALDGTLTTGGYKQALVTITPQAGQTLSNINLSVKHNQAGLVNSTSSQWLDIRLAMNNTGTVTMYNTSWRHCFLEQFEWVGSNSQTTFSNMFNSCYSLQSIPLLNTSLGTNFSSMFSNCYFLQSIPLLDTSSGTSFDTMFGNCYSLQSIPLLNTSLGTTFSQMFIRCYSLQGIPLLNTSLGTSFSSMFYDCRSLQSIPLLNTSSGTNFSSTFYNCYSLQSIPLLDTSSGTGFTSMFGNCYSLQSIPQLDTSKGISFSSMFLSCYSLQSIPQLDTSSGTSFSNMFLSCNSLANVDAIFPNNQSISFASCALGPNALNEIYTNLPVASGTPTITVTGNWGTTGDDPTIATAKGWTVVGS
jgi:hypothetical protein